MKYNVFTFYYNQFNAGVLGSFSSSSLFIQFLLKEQTFELI